MKCRAQLDYAWVAVCHALIPVVQAKAACARGTAITAFYSHSCCFMRVPRWRCFLNPDLKRPSDDPLTEWEVAVIVEVRGEHTDLCCSLLDHMT